MPRERSDAWEEVGRSVTDLRERIREHFRAQREEAGPGSPEERRQALGGTLEEVVRRAGTAVEALGEVFHDHIVREHAVRTSRALADAVVASMAEIGEEVRQAGERIRRRGDR
jgi:hypothetical protein